MRVLCCICFFASSAWADENGMQTRSFTLKNELIGGHTFVRPKQNLPLSPMGFQTPIEPFVANIPDDKNSPLALRQTATAVLLNEGIPFPPGAKATFHPQSGVLSVCNTPENLRHTQLFLESFEQDLPVNLSYLVTVIEAPGEVIRQASTAAASITDCSSQLSALLAAAKQPESTVRVVGDAFIESESGRRSTFSSVQEHIFPSGMTTTAKNAVNLGLDLLESGLKFEAEPWQDERDLNIRLGLITLPPFQRMLSLSDSTKDRQGSFPATAFWQSELMASISCQSGHTRLISVAKPLGAKDKDVLWAVFITVCSQRIASVHPPFATAVAPPGSAANSRALKQIMFDLPEGFLEFFLTEPNPSYLPRWLECNGLEKVKGASAHMTDGKLEVINTQENIERIHGMLREMRRSLPGTAVCVLNTIEAPAARLRDLTRAHVTHGDHAALWRALEVAVSKGEASYVNTAQITADADFRTAHHSGQENSLITSFSTNQSGQTLVDFEKRTTGSVIELETWVPPQDDYVHIHLTHELQTGPATTTRHTFKHPATGQPFEFPSRNLHTTRTTQSFSITPSSTRLVSLCRPTSKEKSDVLWATFISCEVVRQIPSRHNTHSIPESGTVDPLKLETRVFQPPNGFFSSSSSGWGPITPEAAKHALEESGVSMDPEAELRVSTDSSILRVKSTRKCLDQIDTMFKKTADRLSQSVVIEAHLFEGPGPFLRDATQNVLHRNDHASLLASLQSDAKIGKVKNVTTLRVAAKDGGKTHSEQVRQIQQLTGIRPTENEGTEFILETLKSGHIFSLEPKILPNEDAVTLEFTLDFSNTEPVEYQEHLIDTNSKRIDFPLLDVPHSGLTSKVTISPGATRLVWICRPPDAVEDRLQVLFLHYSLN